MTAQLLWYTTQGNETVTTYKIIDTKQHRGTEWKIYGRKSGCKNAENSQGGKKIIWQFEDCVHI
jgi:hypothetical protein